MQKLVHLIVAGAVAAGGATAIAVAGGASPALACGVSPGGPAARAYADSLPVLRNGSRGATVLGLQYVLRDQGATYLTGTGTFAGNTETAVKHFQHVNHLPMTGVVDHAMWQKIIVNDFHVPWNAPNPQLSPGASLKSTHGEELTSLTERMHGLPWFRYNAGQSRYDGSLLSEVRTFQNRVGVKNSGIFGARTTEKMVTVIAIAGHEACNI